MVFFTYTYIWRLPNGYSNVTVLNQKKRSPTTRPNFFWLIPFLSFFLLIIRYFSTKKRHLPLVQHIHITFSSTNFSRYCGSGGQFFFFCITLLSVKLTFCFCTSMKYKIRTYKYYYLNGFVWKVHQLPIIVNGCVALP